MKDQPGAVDGGWQGVEIWKWCSTIETGCFVLFYRDSKPSARPFYYRAISYI